jgi:hypothetical protein
MPPIPNFDRQKFISSFANATPCPAFKYSTSSKQLARNKYWSFLQQRQKRKKRFITLAPVQPPCLQHYQLPQRADQQDEPHSGVQTFR